MLKGLAYFIEFLGHTTNTFGFQMFMLLHTDSRGCAI